MGQIDKLYNQLVITFGDDRQKESKLKREISKIISSAYSSIMGSDQSFCFKFPLPIRAVENTIPDLMNLSKNDIYEAFKSDWGSNVMRNKMHSDPYYQILLLLLLYFIRQKDEKMQENVAFIMGMKLWNGRRTKYLKYCDKDIMKYVTTYMVSKRHNVGGKYEDPLDLLKNWFVPSLLKTYAPRIQRDSYALKALFEQGHQRIRQLFVQQGRLNIQTGKSEAQSGLLPLYMKAHREGLSMKTPNVQQRGDEDSSPSYAEYTTGSARDEIIDTTTDHIVMNSNPSYNQAFINHLHKENKVSKNVIEKILKGLHRHEYSDLVHNILGIILSQTNANDKQTICSRQFYELVDKNVLRSKNNKDARALQNYIMQLLSKILDKEMGIDVKNYSVNNQIQLRKIVLHAIVLNLRNNVCT